MKLKYVLVGFYLIFVILIGFIVSLIEIPIGMLSDALVAHVKKVSEYVERKDSENKQ